MNTLHELAKRFRAASKSNPRIKMNGASLMIELSAIKKERKQIKAQRKRARKAHYNVFAKDFDIKKAIVSIPSYNGSEVKPDHWPTTKRPKPPDPGKERRKQQQRYKQQMLQFNLETIYES